METLDSLQNQTYRPIQLIVIDDGSDDDTEQWVLDVKANSPDRVEITYRKQEQAGGPAARNHGAKLSTGEFIVFMDDDDVASADFVEARVNALNTSDTANLAFGTWQSFFTEDGKYRLLGSKGMIPGAVDAPWEAFLNNWDLLLQGCLIRRQLIHRVGPWRTELSKSQDLDYKARLLAEECCAPVYSEDGIVFYRLHHDSISGNLGDTKFDSYLEVVDRIENMAIHRDGYEDSKDHLGDYLWFHSFWLYGKGDFARGYRELKRARVHSPRICRRKGLLPMLLDMLGLDVAIGPGYYFISQCKKSLGLRKRKVHGLTDRLPTSVTC
jgi:glycosyltransferase involved in cell wall biosynthesis